jgi:hypothetical protein
MAESIYVLGDEDRKKFAKLIAQAWTDDAITAEYNANPHAVLSEYGISYPSEVTAPVIPPKPVGDLSVEELEMAAGGCLGTASSLSTIGGTAFTAATAGSGLS